MNRVPLFQIVAILALLTSSSVAQVYNPVEVNTAQFDIDLVVENTVHP